MYNAENFHDKEKTSIDSDVVLLMNLEQDM